jgi:hypothetical protein
MTRVVSGNTTSVCLSTYQLSDDQIQFYYLQLIHATGTKIVVHSSHSTHTNLTSIFSFSFLSFLSSLLLQGAHAIMFQIFSNSLIFHTSCTAFFFLHFLIFQLFLRFHKLLLHLFSYRTTFTFQNSSALDQFNNKTIVFLSVIYLELGTSITK